MAASAGSSELSQLPAQVQQQIGEAVANDFVQHVDYGNGRTLPLISSPVQHDRTAPVMTRAPEFAADTDEILASIGMSEDEILEAKISGAVV